MTASPISDMNPMLASMGATLVIARLSDSDGDNGGDVEVTKEICQSIGFLFELSIGRFESR